MNHEMQSIVIREHRRKGKIIYGDKAPERNRRGYHLIHTPAYASFQQRLRDSLVYQEEIARRRTLYRVGEWYNIMIPMWISVESETMHPVAMRCKCIYRNDHYALFEHGLPPYTLRTGLRYEDIVPVV